MGDLRRAFILREAPASSVVPAVRSAIGKIPSDQWFGQKVFISDIYGIVGPQLGISRHEFNSALVDANRKNQLTLARADLPQAMDPKKVRDSEIELRMSGGTIAAVFHFVVADSVNEKISSAEITRIRSLDPTDEDDLEGNLDVLEQLVQAGAEVADDMDENPGDIGTEHVVAMQHFIAQLAAVVAKIRYSMRGRG